MVMRCIFRTCAITDITALCDDAMMVQYEGSDMGNFYMLLLSTYDCSKCCMTLVVKLSIRF